MIKNIKKTNKINLIYPQIKEVLETARSKAYKAVNFAMVEAYWNIGRLIVEEEQKGGRRRNCGRRKKAEKERADEETTEEKETSEGNVTEKG